MTELHIKCPEELNHESGSHLCSLVVRDFSPDIRKLVLEMDATCSMDSLGGAWLLEISGFLRKRHAELEWCGQNGDVADFMMLLAPALQSGTPAPSKASGLLENLGGILIDAAAEFKQFLDLSVDAVYWTLIAPFEGRGFRVNACVDEVHEMGVRAVRIVFLMNFLMGLIIAMLSAKQVESFGLQIYVADLIVIGFARELAAVVTAVVVSARTGAAIAAELATMKVQEEIDALKGMGLNVAQYLVTPKLLALIVVLPCLAVLGLISGVLGGSLWGVAVLGFRPSIWFTQTLNATYMDDLMQGMLQTIFFAIAIVMIACHNGLRVTGGSRGVGLMTTRAVVMDIFSLICIDIVFALIFYYIMG